MMYRAEEEQVTMFMGRGETQVIATCLNNNWARHIAELLQADYDET